MVLLPTRIPPTKLTQCDCGYPRQQLQHDTLLTFPLEATVDLSFNKEMVGCSQSFPVDLPRNAYEEDIIVPSMCWDAAEPKGQASQH